MKKLLFTLCAFSLLHACVLIRMDDSIDLGSNYRFVQDYPQGILYHHGQKYEGIGIEIIPPLVISYKFNDRYILAKSQEIDEMTGSKEGLPIHYWIIDKTSNGAPVDPLDSASFYKLLKELEIDIKL